VDTEGVPLAIKVSYSKVRCAECAADERVIGMPCAVCGKRGRTNEVNGQVIDRRQAIAAARRVAKEGWLPSHSPGALNPLDWRQFMSGLLESVIRTLGQLSEQPMDPTIRENAGRAMGEISGFSSWLDELAPLRPYVQHLHASRDAASCLVRMMEHYLRAMESESPLVAQKLAREAQSEIDLSVAILDRADRQRKYGDRLGESSPDTFVKVALDVLAESRPELSLFEVDREWQASLTESLHRQVAPGQGVSYAVANLLAESTLDAERFRAVVGEATEVFRSGQYAAQVASEAGSLEYILKARNAIVESTVAFSASLATSATETAQLRRAMNLYRELFEDGASPLFAWFLRLAGAKSAPLSKLMQEDSTSLLDAVNRNNALAKIFYGADKGIRTAASHGHAYELRGSRVHFSARSFQTSITVAEFLDRLLAMTESLLAALWVLDNELAALGATGHSPTGSLLGEPMFAIAEQVIRHLGGEVLESADKGATWSFTLAASPTANPFMVAYALAAHEQASAQEIEIIRPDLVPGELRVPKTASALYSTFVDLPPLQLIESNYSFIEASTLNGRSAAKADDLRRTTCIAAIALLSNDDLSAIPLIRRCLAWARAQELPDVVEFGEQGLAEWRKSDQGRLTRLLETMDHWNKLPSPSLPLVRKTTIVVG
jgi:hypothetical protein